jgi:hypothetical protein
MPSPQEEWWLSPPTDLEGALLKLQQRAAHIEDPTEEGTALRNLLTLVEQQYEILNDEVKKIHPLAFFKPSLEQSLLLNAWVWGIDFPVCFSANRIGKTTAFVINALLWMLPNDPNWEAFSPKKTHGLNRDGDPILVDNPLQDSRRYIDHLQREVQLLPRPKMSTLMEIRDVLKRHPQLLGDPRFSHLDEESGNHKKFVTLQSLVPALLQCDGAWPFPPIYDSSSTGTIWLGAPDNDFHSEIILKEWKRWLPTQYVHKWVESELYFILDTKDTTNPSPMKWEIYCKSYESEDTKWSGSAVYGVVLTEGLTPSVLNEIKMRIKEGGFASWDYTPYEPTNAGQKTALAHKVYSGKEQLPLRAHIFTKFSARNAPNFILPESKREDLIRMWEGKKEGDARLDGIFYSTSPLVLSRLDRTFHTLPWTKEELFERFPNGQLYRGFDAGYDHPSVCVWALLAPGNQWFFYRFYSERGRTIPERCDDIISLSGNVRKQFKIPGTNQVIYKEMHLTSKSEVYNLTAADYHLFKTDEQSGIPYVNNYHREGLILTESTHMKPEDRALEFDRKLTPNKFITHPLTGKTPGASIFFLINEYGVDAALQKMESLYWERLHGGPNKGEAKDTVPIHGDDELDAACYLACGPYNYNNFRPKPNDHFLEEEEDLATQRY